MSGTGSGGRSRALKQNISGDLSVALDLVFVQTLLAKQRLTDARLYFRQEVLPRELARSTNVEAHYITLNEIDRAGIFTRITLPELKEYAAALDEYEITNQTDHDHHISEFVRYVHRFNLPGVVAFNHINRMFKVGVILCGVPSRIKIEGLRPYVRRIGLDAQIGAETVYVIAYGRHARKVIRQIVRRAEQLGLAEKDSIQHFTSEFRLFRNDNSTTIRENVLARLRIRKDWAKAWNEIKDWDEIPGLTLEDALDQDDPEVEQDDGETAT